MDGETTPPAVMDEGQDPALSSSPGPSEANSEETKLKPASEGTAKPRDEGLSLLSRSEEDARNQDTSLSESSTSPAGSQRVRVPERTEREEEEHPHSGALATTSSSTSSPPLKSQETTPTQGEDKEKREKRELTLSPSFRRSMELDMSALSSPKRRIKSVLSPFHAQSPAKQENKVFFPADGTEDQERAWKEKRDSSTLSSSHSTLQSLSSGQESSSLSEIESPPLYDWAASGSITPLHAAVSFGYVSEEHVSQLLAEGADPNAVDENGCTPLHLSVAFAYLLGVQTLVQRGADLEVRDFNGQTPVFYTCQCGEYAEIMMTEMINLGARVDVADNFGYQLVHYTAANGLVDCLRLLLDRDRGLIDQPNQDGDTLLHLAAKNGFDSCIFLLLSRGADYSLKNLQGNTPLVEALLQGAVECVRLLQSAEAKGGDRQGEEGKHKAGPGTSGNSGREGDQEIGRSTITDDEEGDHERGGRLAPGKKRRSFIPISLEDEDSSRNSGESLSSFPRRVSVTLGISDAELNVEESDQSEISSLVKEVEYFLVHAAVNASQQAEESNTLSSAQRNKVLSDENALKEVLKKFRSLMSKISQQDRRRRNRVNSMKEIADEATSYIEEAKSQEESIFQLRKELESTKESLKNERSFREELEHRLNSLTSPMTAEREVDPETIREMQKHLAELSDETSATHQRYKALEASYQALSARNEYLEAAKGEAEREREREGEKWKERLERQAEQMAFLQAELEKIWKEMPGKESQGRSYDTVEGQAAIREEDTDTGTQNEEAYGTPRVPYEQEQGQESPMWVPYTTDDGMTYYYNTQTGEVQWEHEFLRSSEQFPGPTEVTRENSSLPSSSLPSSSSPVSSPLPTSMNTQKIGAVWNRFFENAIIESEKRKSFQEQVPDIFSIAATGSEKELEALLAAGGGQTAAVDDQGRTALHISCEKGKPNLVALLCDYDADINAQDHLGNTPLHIASLFGQSACLQILLECAAEVDQINKMEDTALHLAVWKGNLDCVKQLIDYGADPLKRNIYGQSPYGNFMTRSPLRHHLKELPPTSSIFLTLNFLQQIGAGEQVESPRPEADSDEDRNFQDSHSEQLGTRSQPVRREREEEDEEEGSQEDEDDGEEESEDEGEEMDGMGSPPLSPAPADNKGDSWQGWGVPAAVSSIFGRLMASSPRSLREETDSKEKTQEKEGSDFYYDEEKKTWILQGEEDAGASTGAGRPPTDAELDPLPEPPKSPIPPPSVREALEKVQKSSSPTNKKNAGEAGEGEKEEDDGSASFLSSNVDSSLLSPPVDVLVALQLEKIKTSSALPYSIANNRYSLQASPTSPQALQSRYVDTFNSSEAKSGD